MAFSRSLARFNKQVTNRIQGAWAPWIPPYALIVHKGRRTGATYRTPVLAWVEGATLVVALYYGAESDWVRNVIADGGATVVRLGKEHRLVNPRVVSARRSGVSHATLVFTRPAAKLLIATIS